jgi:predicted PurR-regulated permease PerM
LLQAQPAVPHRILDGRCPIIRVVRREAFLWTARGMGVALGVGIVVALGLLAVRSANVLILLFLAILLASALEPFVGWVRSHVPLGRGATILVVYAVFAAGVAWLAVLVFPAALRQADELAQALPGLLEDARRWAEGLSPQAFQTSVRALLDAVGEQFKAAPPPEPGEVVEAGLTVAELVVSLVTLMALVFFWLVEHARLQRYALAFVPASRRGGWREAWNEIETRLGLWVRGQLILMFAIGIASGVAYWLLGLPSALLLGLFAGIAEGIPIIGPALGAIPAILVALTVSPELAIVVALVYIVLQFLEGNVLVPIVMKNTIGLSPFVVLVALLAGAAAAGIVGAFLAVPVVAAVEVVLERLQAREVPVAQEPSGSSPDPGTTDEQGRSLPDSAAGARAG